MRSRLASARRAVAMATARRADVVPRGPIRRSTALLLAVLATGCATQQAREEAPERHDVSPAIASGEGTPVEAGAPGALASDRHDLASVAGTGRIQVAPAHEDVWQRIRDGLALAGTDHARIEAEVAWFARNQRYLDRVAARARLYLPYIAAEVERRGLPMELALLPVVESAFQPFAFSPMGASGLWQFMPSTGRRYGLRQTYWYDGRRDVVESTRAALDYLESLEREFSGDWLLAVAAYNSGSGNVRRALRRNHRADRPTDFFSLRLPRETRAYVPRLLAVARIVAAPEAHGVTLEPIDGAPTFELVPVDSQIDLAVAAEAAGITLDELFLLNPGYNHWATDPAGPHRLAVPVDAAETLREALAALPRGARMGWRTHRVAPGDSLSVIAANHQTTIGVLREVNGIEGTTIVAGSDLAVPVAAHEPARYELSAATTRMMGRRMPFTGSHAIYRVREGDSLWLIARRHGTTVAKLTAANAISPRATLRPGQRLVVQGKPAPDARAAPTRRRGAGLYVVRSGDSLWMIARRHHVSVSDLTSWNGLSRKATLRPGQELRVQPAGATAPAPSPVAGAVRYTVLPGDSLWLIARRFDVRVAALREWNALPEGATLRPGQTLEIRPGPPTKT